MEVSTPSATEVPISFPNSDSSKHASFETALASALRGRLPPSQLCTLLRRTAQLVAHPVGPDVDCSILPCGPPFPVTGLTPPKSPRRRARWVRSQTRRLWVNAAVSLLSWIAVGRRMDEEYFQLLARPLTTAQWSLVRGLEQRFSGLCRPGQVIDLPGGGLHSLHEMILSAHSACYDGSVGPGAPENLTPQNMSVPKVGADILLEEPVVPVPLAQLFRDPDAFALPPHLLPPHLPPRCLRVSCMRGVLARLWDVKLLAPCPDAELVWHNQEVVRAGLFGVAKKNTDLLRVIVDRRMRNACERGLEEVLVEHCLKTGVEADQVIEYRRRMVFPHASQFIDLFVPQGSRLNIDVDDAADFYYLMAWSRAQLPHNVVGDSVSASDLLLAGVTQDVDRLRDLGDQKRYWSLLSPAMGDQKAALTAQLVHTTALRDRNLLPDEAWMTFGFPPPCADSWEGAYQDDHALVSVVPPGEEGERVLENARATRSQVHTAYQEVGIVRKVEKEVTGATEGVVWGGELSTERCDVGGEVGKVHFLAMITLRVCCVGVISGWLLQKLLGCWVHHLCFRRCGFSLLDFSFAWMRQKDVPKHQKRHTPPTVSDELLALAILWPCWRADLANW